MNIIVVYCHVDPQIVVSGSATCRLFSAQVLSDLAFQINFFNRVLNASAKRKPDQAAPEITLNPLESIGAGNTNTLNSIL